jgi:hypothetical protein
LREAQRDAVEHTFARLMSASSEAVTVLHDLMKRDDVPASARINAARITLDNTYRTYETEQVKTQIEELKEYLRSKQEEDMLDAAARRMEQKQ